MWDGERTAATATSAAVGTLASSSVRAIVTTGGIRVVVTLRSRHAMRRSALAALSTGSSRH